MMKTRPKESSALGLQPRATRIAAAMCLVFAMSIGCTESDGVDQTKLGYHLPPNETHLTFTLAETPGKMGQPPLQSALTLRIPRKHVDLDSVLSKNGSIYQLTVPFELPGPAPWSASAPTSGNQDTAKDYRDPKNWPARFRVVLGAGSGVGGRARFLHGIDPNNVHGIKNMVRDGTVHGLVRYSRVFCYTAEELKNPAGVAHLAAKETDDPVSQPNCRTDRRLTELFSPPEVVAEDEVVFIDCMYTTCACNFHYAGGRGASLRFDPALLAYWPKLVDQARELLRSFIVRDAAPTRTLEPPSAKRRY